MGLFTPKPAPPPKERTFAADAAKGGDPIVAKKTALVCIEFQNEFTTEGGKLYAAVKPCMEETDMLNKTVSLADAVRRAGGKVFHVPISFKKDATDNPNKRIGILAGCANDSLFTVDTWNAEICKEMTPAPGDVVVSGKKGLDAYPGTDLEAKLVANGIETVMLCGFLTNCCVESTMRTSCEKGFNVVTVTDCCATTSMDGHKAATGGTFGLFSTPMTAEEAAAAFPIASQLKVRGMGLSHNVIAPVLFAKSLGGGFEEMNIMKGEHKTPEMLKINPFHQMPNMSDGDVHLGESGAMIRYMANRYAPEKYGGEDLATKATIDWAMDWLGTNFGPKFVKIWYPTAGFGALAEDQKAENATAVTSLGTFAAHFLKGPGKFIGGATEPSIADYMCAAKFHCLGVPAIKAKTGFELPARIVQYVADFMAVCPGKEFLQEHDGFMAAKMAEAEAEASAPAAEAEAEAVTSAPAAEAGAEAETTPAAAPEAETEAESTPAAAPAEAETEKS